MESGPLDWDLALEVEIWTSMLVSGPSGYDLGLEARIFASRLGLGSQDRDLRGGMEEEEEEKILFMKCATKSILQKTLSIWFFKKSTGQFKENKTFKSYLFLYRETTNLACGDTYFSTIPYSPNP